jgi:hypothetical protein
LAWYVRLPKTYAILFHRSTSGFLQI